MSNITLLEQIDTEIGEYTVWQHYTCGETNSFVLLYDEDTEEHEIINIIENKLPHIIDLSSLSPYLQELINNCNQSFNDMWFIESDDDFYLSQSEEFKIALMEEVKRNNLDNYIVFNEENCLITLFGDETLITVFGGISEIINFNN